MRKLPNQLGMVMMRESTRREYPADRLTVTGVRVAMATAHSPFGVGAWMRGTLDRQLEKKWGFE